MTVDDIIIFSLFVFIIVSLRDIYQFTYTRYKIAFIQQLEEHRKQLTVTECFPV